MGELLRDQKRKGVKEDFPVGKTLFSLSLSLFELFAICSSGFSTL
jgi:hypothetical protein